jgi:putative nucleotidyltransferase with HDIG domain
VTLEKVRFRRNQATVIYTGVLAVLAVTTLVALVALGLSVGNVWVIVVLAAAAIVAERGSVRLSETVEVSISLVPTLFAAVLFGPLAAALVAAASNLLDLRGGGPNPLLKWMTYTSTRTLTGAGCGFAAILARDGGGDGLAGVVLATAAAAIVAETLEVCFAALTIHVRGRGSLREILVKTVPLTFVAVPLYGPIVAGLVVSYEALSAWTVPLFLLPALAAQRLFVMYEEQRRLAEDLRQVNVRLERATLSFATALVTTLDARDQYTAGHSAAVAVYSRDIAARMGLSEQDQQLAHLCGLVHDIGKIGLSPGVLEKPGPLTLDERRHMETHSEIGERILAKVEEYSEVARIVRHHHERIDGMGYPDRVPGDEIPMISRIIAVADAYNAMTSDRPYRDAMPSRVARLRLAQAVESQFDTSVVAAFEAILASADESYRVGQRADFFIEERIALSA